MQFYACKDFSMIYSLDYKQIVISLPLLDIDHSTYPVKKITITVKNVGDYS